LLIGLIMLLLGGCVRATYHASQGEEDFKLWSVLKSVDGLAVDREGKDFSLDIDKTHTLEVERRNAEDDDYKEAIAALELTKKQESWARLDCGRFITKDVLRGG